VRKNRYAKGIDGLAVVASEYKADELFDEEALYLFCGRSKDRYKALYWEKDGFTLSYKRIEQGKLQWPKESDESVKQLSDKQYRWLLEGLSVVQPKAV
jgi:transposase